MKQWIITLLAFVLVCALAACGEHAEETAQAVTNPPESAAVVQISTQMP